jgi:hypothetical protein
MTISTYLGYKIYANNITQSLQRVAAEPENANAQSYYLANIGKVTSVDQFVGNYQLLTYAMNAYGLADMGYAPAFMKKVLDSNLSDPHSFANSLSDPRYVEFAKAYQFTTTGSVASTAQVQTSTQQTDTVAKFAAASTASSSEQSSDTTYFKKNIGSVTSVAALEKDPTLYNYVLTAYGIDTTKTPESSVTAALESNLSDPNSFANTSGNAGLKALAADFNFASDGSVSRQRQLQSPASLSATVAAYSSVVGTDTTKAAAKTDTAAEAAAKTETAYYQATMPTLTSVDQFLGNARLVAYAEKAYGLPKTTTTSQLKAALESNLNDPKSAASKLGQNFVTFAASFNISTTGTITQTPTVQAQSRAQVVATTNAYLNQSMETEAGTNEGTGVQLALYFQHVAPTITNPYQILADKALTQVVQTMLGLSATSSNADIDTQANTITSRLNLADFQDPQKLDKLVARFSALYDVENNTSANNPMLQLFGIDTSSS